MPSENQQQRLFSLDHANRTLPLVSRIVEEIVDLDQTRARLYREAKKRVASGCLEDAARLQDEIQEIAFRQDECAGELRRIGCELKDPSLGLVDFPARLGDRVVYLCWKLGEDKIGHWHEIDAGFPGRQPITGQF